MQPEPSNDLEIFFRNNTNGNLIHKWNNFFSIYERHLNQFRNKPVNILEIGISQGGSLDMWRNYFGKDANIFAIDVDPRCSQFESEKVKIFIGDQGDREFLRSVKEEIPPLDILIDDGGHTMKQQIASFEELYDHVNNTGVYICEDLCTSYYRRYGGGYKKKGSFIEYSKNFIDYINAWFSESKTKLAVSEFTKNTDSLHYYAGMIVLEKGVMAEPFTESSGVMQFDSEPSLAKKVLNRIKM